MAYGQKFEPRVSLDRFGNKQQIRFAAKAWNKKDQTNVDGIYKTIVTLGSKEYTIQVSEHCNKQNKHGVGGVWITVTERSGAGGRSASSLKM